MSVTERIGDFQSRFGKELEVGSTVWRYYKLGDGPPFVWLPGGIRRAVVGYEFLELLSKKRTVIAPDYPAFRSIEELDLALDSILAVEGVGRFTLSGQSYGGLLAQAYLAHCVDRVDQLVLSSSGPAGVNSSLLPMVRTSAFLARILPLKTVRRLVGREMLKLIEVPDTDGAEWQRIVSNIIFQELGRSDLVSHFAVSVDMVRAHVVCPEAFEAWDGQVIVMTSENDPTQRPDDLQSYERLFGRPAIVIGLGTLGHTAVVRNPRRFVELLEPALAE